MTEEVRISRLREVFHKALNSSLDSCSTEKFSACFSGLGHVATRDAHAQIITRLRENCAKEFEVILESKDIPAKLSSLEELIKSQETSSSSSSSSSLIAAEAASGNNLTGEEATAGAVKAHSPEEILRAQLLAVKRERSERLRKELKQLEEDNGKLHEAISELRKRHKTALERVEKKRGCVSLAAMETTGTRVEEIWEVVGLVGKDHVFRVPEEPVKKKHKKN